MLEGGDVSESTIMKKKNLQRNMEHKVGQFEIGYCFGSKIFGANIVELADWPSMWCLISKANTQSPLGLGIIPLLIEIVCYIIKSILNMKGQPNN